MTRAYPSGADFEQKRRIDWRRRLVKIIPRDRLERLIDAEKRPHMMGRLALEATVVSEWDDEIKDALLEMLVGNI